MKLFVPNSVDGWTHVGNQLHQLCLEDRPRWAAMMRAYSKQSAYFLARYVLSTRTMMDPYRDIPQIELPFIFDRIVEAQTKVNRDRVFQNWARGHWKSTLWTFVLPIWTLIRNPAERIAIYSIHKDKAIELLSRIKTELEDNGDLRALFPEVFYAEPRKQSRLWRREELKVRHPGNFREPSISAWGLLDSLPTGSHMSIHVFDDIVDRVNSQSEEMVKKSLEQYQAAIKCSHRVFETWIVGTRYAENDLYEVCLDEGIFVRENRRPCLDFVRPRPDLKDIGGHEPVFLTPDELRVHRGKGETARRWYAWQYLCDPTAAMASALPVDHIGFYDAAPMELARRLTKMVCVDPSGMPRGRRQDDTAIVVLGIDREGRRHVLDIVASPMTPGQRHDKVVALVKLWGQVGPPVVVVRVEETGQSTEHYHISEALREAGERVRVERCVRGGRHAQSKNERIYAQLHAPMDHGDLIFPRSMMRTRRTQRCDLVQVALDQLRQFPMAANDDIPDSLAMSWEPEDKARGIRRVPRPGDPGIERRIPTPPPSDVPVQYGWMVA